MEKFFTVPSDFFSEEVVSVFRHVTLVMPNWKWMILIASLVIGFLIRPFLQIAFRIIKGKFAIAKKFPHSVWSYFLKSKIERPLSWILTTLFWLFIADILAIPGNLDIYYSHALKGLLAFQLISLAYYGVDALGAVMLEKASKTTGTFDDQMATFTKKVLKVLVVVLGTLIVLQSFGLNVVSLLAGLGLGGLALALAAQDTAANVFGSITIMFDQPFQVGDWIKVGSNEGTVEEIGFRSTRIRTFYNSVITIPNSMIAKETVDNMGVRPARRVRQNIGITYETPPEVIEEFCATVRLMVQGHPKVRQSTVTVAFNNYADSSLNILLNFHLEVYTGDEEMEHQQAIFLEILRIAARMKVDFAYPTQTVYQTNMNPEMTPTTEGAPKIAMTPTSPT